MIDVIAEIGSSPAPDWNFKLWCAVAHHVGATHIKAQCFKAEHFPSAEQVSKHPLEFPRERMAEFVQVAHEHRLKAGVSVFDDEAVGLAGRHCDFIKLAAREQFNRLLIFKVYAHHCQIYRSIFDFSFDVGVSNSERIATLFSIQMYPAPMMTSLIRSMVAAYRLRQYLRWGWSSHTRGWLDCWLAARLGASVIEKHLALQATDIEAGHSLLPREFARMVRHINGKM